MVIIWENENNFGTPSYNITLVLQAIEFGHYVLRRYLQSWNNIVRPLLVAIGRSQFWSMFNASPNFLIRMPTGDELIRRLIQYERGMNCEQIVCYWHVFPKFLIVIPFSIQNYSLLFARKFCFLRGPQTACRVCFGVLCVFSHCTLSVTFLFDLVYYLQDSCKNVPVVWALLLYIYSCIYF